MKNSDLSVDGRYRTGSSFAGECALSGFFPKAQRIVFFQKARRKGASVIPHQQNQQQGVSRSTVFQTKPVQIHTEPVQIHTDLVQIRTDLVQIHT